MAHLYNGIYENNKHIDQLTSNSYTMGCPPVRGDNPRTLASGLFYAQVDKHGIRPTILYHNNLCRPCTSRDISRLSLVMPNDDPRDGFFYPPLTLMIDYYNLLTLLSPEIILVFCLV